VNPIVTLDPETLREVVAEPDALRRQIAELRRDIQTAPDATAELLARGELVTLLRVLGELDDALEQAQRAVDRAQLAGTAPQQHLARVRLAQVHEWRGEFAQSTMLFVELLNGAVRFGPVIEGYTREQAGKNSYTQGLWSDALFQFAAALTLREAYKLPERELETSRLGLAATRRHLAAGSA
jgi:tetratricopeptide (TPR) repeat protein